LLPAATVVSPFKETLPVPVAKVPVLADWSKLPAPEAKVKLLPAPRVVLPFRPIPQEPDWTVVVDVPLVEPSTVVWLEAPVPKFKSWPVAASIEAAVPVLPKVSVLELKVLVL